MRRCDYCRGKLGLIVHRKWRRRFCKRACKTAFECRRRDEVQRRWGRLACLSGLLDLLAAGDGWGKARRHRARWLLITSHGNAR
jgi:hypothetical protein